MMLKMRALLFTSLVLFPLATEQLNADQQVKRYAENKQVLNPDKRREIILPTLRLQARRSCSFPSNTWCK
nr:conotoxin precursor M [Conus ebraeus]